MKEIEIVIASDQTFGEVLFTTDCLISMRNAINQRARNKDSYPLLWCLSVPIGVVTNAKLVEHVGDRIDLIVTAELDEEVIASADTKIDLNKYVGAIGYTPQFTTYEKGIAIHKELSLISVGVIHQSLTKSPELPAIKIT